MWKRWFYLQNRSSISNSLWSIFSLILKENVNPSLRNFNLKVMKSHKFYNLTLCLILAILKQSSWKSNNVNQTICTRKRNQNLDHPFVRIMVDPKWRQKNSLSKYRNVFITFRLIYFWYTPYLKLRRLEISLHFYGHSNCKKSRESKKHDDYQWLLFVPFFVQNSVHFSYIFWFCLRHK